MSTLEATVMAAFYERLSATQDVNQELIEALRLSLDSATLPKPDDLAQLIAAKSGEERA